MSEIHDLLARAGATIAQTSNKDGIQRIQQGIPDLQKRAALLLQTGGAGRGGDEATVRARSFLPAEPLEGMSRLAYTLEQKSAFQAGAPPPVPGPEADLEGFLNSHYDMLIYAAIEEAAHAADSLAHKAQLRWEEEDWENAKADLRKRKEEQPAARILDTGFLLRERPDLMEVDNINPALAQSLLAGPSRLTPTQRRYAEVVRRATSNDPQMQYGLCQMFMRLVEELAGSLSDPISDLEQFKKTIELLADMFETVDASGARSRLEGVDLDDVDTRRRVLADGARVWIEKGYQQAMERKVEKAQREGRVRIETGGPLGVAGAYAAVSRSGGMGNSGAVYETLYHLLRSGHPGEAVHHARDMGLPKEVVEALQMLSRPEEFDIKRADAVMGAVRDVGSKREASMDMFEKSVLNLLGFGNVLNMDKREVVKTTEDYLWWSLWFTRELNPGNRESSVPGTPFTVRDLAQKILKWGERHFDPDGSKSFIYARILFIIQMFREGVSHLHKTKQVEATHTALILDYYHTFVDLSRTGMDMDIVAPGFVQSYADTLENLVVEYIQDFSDTDVCEAADYLMCLRPPRKLEDGVQGLLREANNDERRRDLAVYLRGKVYDFEYVAEERVGGESSGPRKHVLRRYTWSEERAMAVCKRAARWCEDKDVRKAVALYVLADDYVSAVRVLNKRLCHVVVPPSREREEVVREALAFEKEHMSKLPAGAHDAMDAARTNRILLTLRDFFDLVDVKEYDSALKVVYDQLHLLPDNVREVGMAIDEFRTSPPEMKYVMGQVALQTMLCLYEKYRELTRERLDYRQVRPLVGVGGVEEGRRGVEAEGGRIKERAQCVRDLVLGVAQDLPGDMVARAERFYGLML